MQGFGFYQQALCTFLFWRGEAAGIDLEQRGSGLLSPRPQWGQASHSSRPESCDVQKITSGSPICWEKMGLAAGWIGGTETEEEWTVSA